MSALSDINGLNLILRKRMDLERRAFTRRCVAAIRKVAQRHEVMSPAALAEIRIALEPILEEWYGRFPGDEQARFWRLITQETARATSLAARREREMVTRILTPYPKTLAQFRGRD